MMTQEFLNAVMQERTREAAELQRRYQARKLKGRDAAPRGGLSLPRLRRLPLPSCVARGFRTASAP